MVYIGIDLGTTYSCVAIVENGRPVTIHNDHGSYTTPSVVAYSNHGIIVGSSAISCDTDLSNILYDSKRLIGWHVPYNLAIAENRNLWTFNVDTKDEICGYVLNKGKPNERFIKAEEVSAEILKHLKFLAENYLSKDILGVVVAIPVSFKYEEKSATRKAVELAGLDLKELVEESKAVAYAYQEKIGLDNSKILIFDFGGGTLDISIIEIMNGEIATKGAAGDPQIGGQDFDGKIMNYALREFKNESEYDIMKKPKLIKRLRDKCRTVKEALSVRDSDNIHLEINDNNEMNVVLSRTKFEELCSDLFEKVMITVNSALNSARLSESEIDYVILAGGSSRIPKIKQIMAGKFGKNRLKFDINPDEAVAHGAAIFAKSIEMQDNVNRLLNSPIDDIAIDEVKSLEGEIRSLPKGLAKPVLERISILRKKKKNSPRYSKQMRVIQIVESCFKTIRMKSEMERKTKVIDKMNSYLKKIEDNIRILTLVDQSKLFEDDFIRIRTIEENMNHLMNEVREKAFKKMHQETKDKISNMKTVIKNFLYKSKNAEEALNTVFNRSKMIDNFILKAKELDDITREDNVMISREVIKDSLFEDAMELHRTIIDIKQYLEDKIEFLKIAPNTNSLIQDIEELTEERPNTRDELKLSIENLKTKKQGIRKILQITPDNKYGFELKKICNRCNYKMEKLMEYWKEKRIAKMKAWDMFDNISNRINEANEAMEVMKGCNLNLESLEKYSCQLIKNRKIIADLYFKIQKLNPDDLDPEEVKKYTCWAKTLADMEHILSSQNEERRKLIDFQEKYSEEVKNSLLKMSELVSTFRELLYDPCCNPEQFAPTIDQAKFEVNEARKLIEDQNNSNDPTVKALEAILTVVESKLIVLEEKEIIWKELVGIRDEIMSILNRIKQRFDDKNNENKNRRYIFDVKKYLDDLRNDYKIAISPESDINDKINYFEKLSICLQPLQRLHEEITNITQRKENYRQIYEDLINEINCEIEDENALIVQSTYLGLYIITITKTINKRSVTNDDIQNLENHEFPTIINRLKEYLSTNSMSEINRKHVDVGKTRNKELYEIFMEIVDALKYAKSKSNSDRQKIFDKLYSMLYKEDIIREFNGS